MFKIHVGDCLDHLEFMPDNSVDAVVTDPPYGLAFMGKKWDYEVPSVEIWRECLRVLKPGGHLLAFAGTRTQHRMAVNIEDAGFEIRDMIAWVYGSGFPKSLDVSKAIDKAAGARGHDAEGFNVAGVGKSNGGSKFRSDHPDYVKPKAVTEAARQWQGWGTALKPALEPITVARKPLIGTVAENVQQHGTGALNIDGCRIEAIGEIIENHGRSATDNGWDPRMSGEQQPGQTAGQALGRWPANLIHDGSEEVLAAFPDASGQQSDVSENAPSSKTGRVYGPMARQREASQDKRYDKQGGTNFAMKPGARRMDFGSAARFFYCAKAGRKDRGEGNGHPTVKPTDLMRYLCRLVTPPGGVVLDPFMGSGSTGKAAVLEGFKFIGIEMEEGYSEIARTRIQQAVEQYGEL